MQLRSGDAEIYCEVHGSGPDLLLVHPFPAHHGIWSPVAEMLATRYRVILPDVRGLGQSPPGEGPATMEKHASDLARLLDELKIPKVMYAGNSIGGYIFFEFWRRHRERVAQVILVDTRASADSDEGRKTRLASAEDVLKRGAEPFLDAQLPKLMGESTHRNRPDKVTEAKRMMMQASPAGIAAVLQGMAARVDSNATLASIDVPALLICGEEDTVTTPVEMEAMHRGIRGSVFRRVPKAGHYAPFEQPEEVHRIMREFLGR
jgi:pimeloyl-ACP methyl ester carboxylesterase